MTQSDDKKSEIAAIAETLDATDLHQLARDTIIQLDLKSHSAERARHKFNMIRLAEFSHAGLPIDGDATGQIVAACEWCEQQVA